ncbi:hypothetical protein HXX76_001656 [Chlamydomonas incerta]|uniref:Carbohydrate kinase PfkB domain-containing protein n=1 Tax=Chlamydomonas incerta TaxID=51695 RepID=A0A836B1G1_CHLIN|nr:hypothetical protein HXX76_001656 [Chlamydomonas incerta]|eukprot:KAG2444920.1 hypothetical protein HXX76_001656 [Chlamydomonas incerta]
MDPSTRENESVLNSGIRVGVLQASALVDHVCSVTRETLERLAGKEVAGSQRCTLEELQNILSSVGEFHSKAGGSASNVGRALALGFGTHVQLVGTRGADEWGVMFTSSVHRAGVDVTHMRVQPDGHTGRSAILTCDGERTMRTYTDPKVTTRPGDLVPADFSGCDWVFLSCYSLYSEGLLPRAVQLANQVGAKVVLDLASYEVVRTYHKQLMEVLQGGGVHFCICNEDEAQMLVRCSEDAAAAAAAAATAGSAVPQHAAAAAAIGFPPDSSLPAAVLGLILRHCHGGVVTRGVLGCVAASRDTQAAAAAGGAAAGASSGLVAVPAVPGIAVVDTTGAGDHFTAGFMYGLMTRQPLERCCEVACLAGASAVRVLGAELAQKDWAWFHARLHGELAGDVVQESSAAEVAQELLGCYTLIGRLGRGVVYFGSARLAQSSPYWVRAIRLAERVAQLLGSPVWTGGGPGMMRAASEGGLKAGVPVGGIRISREAGTNVLTMEDYLSAGSAFTCKYMPARKVALTDAGVRLVPQHRTAYVFLPGGLGTMDELFSILTLMQLGKLGSSLPVPLLIVNWDGFYDGLMSLLTAFDQTGALHASEVRQVMVANTNDQVVEYLAEFYQLPVPEREDAEEEEEAEEEEGREGAQPVGGEAKQGNEQAAAAAELAAEGDLDADAQAEKGKERAMAAMELQAKLEQLATSDEPGGGGSRTPGDGASHHSHGTDAGNSNGPSGRLTPLEAGGKGPLATVLAEAISGAGSGANSSKHRSRRSSLSMTTNGHAVSAEDVLHQLHQQTQPR